MSTDVHHLFDDIWERYLFLAPDAKQIHELFAKQNDGFVTNDHIALRTFNLPKVSLGKIAFPFLQAGYKVKDEYEFPVRKLFSQYFQHSDPQLPKVFISELLVEKLSVESVQIIEKLVAQVDEEKVLEDGFCHSGRPWDIDLHTYEKLLQESEYAAWVAAHGYQANHFTVSINHLRDYQDIQQVNKKIMDAGFKMNESGGLIKGSPSVLLEQSSTLASDVRVDFIDGHRDIPGCFYEFAKRYPMIDGKLYQGFVAASADKIFESTDTRKL
ncbi:MAG: DUF1338 domain-containing protein [Candidatus Endonucleobacter bathymodioli]|uniref:2-oxoadipate dioxygenase/decarboxylase n=1 Tax=Candidatus Endonucleibacter bathymodioli TaxID=539814 RepID=A0AA90NXV2_9GAMM|nr:DUF1338 domain-containing protein [Candidatus Endonucleobacter bathymodioli]